MIKYKFNSDKTIDIYDHTDTKIATLQPPQKIPYSIIDAAMDAARNEVTPGNAPTINERAWNILEDCIRRNIEEIDSEDDL